MTKISIKKIIYVTWILLTCFFLAPSHARVYICAGGPSGDALNTFAETISMFAKDINLRIVASPSGGSIDNIRLVNTVQANIGFAYLSDIYKARKGKLTNDNRKYPDVLAVCSCFDVYFQIVAKAGNKIESTKQLAKKSISIGDADSDSYYHCASLLKETGMNSVKKRTMGANQALGAMQADQIDAACFFSRIPDNNIVELANNTPISFLNIVDISGMLKQAPYYTKAEIPSGTYKGIDKNIKTIKDTCVMIAHPSVDTEDIQKLLNKIYSKEGIAYLISVGLLNEKTSVNDGMKELLIPFHPGAVSFRSKK